MEEEMKHLKILALAATATGALLAVFGAGTASATVICSTTADPCPSGQAWPNGTKIDWSGSSVIQKDTSGNTIDNCTTSTINGEITNTGSATETVTLTIGELTWGGCTFTTKTVSTGNKLKVHKIAGTSNGTLTSDSQIEWTINTVLFGSCVFGVAAETSVGTLSEGKGTAATFTANATVKRFGTNFACPETYRLTGTYVLTVPSATTFSVSESGS
jgi:hypothetical protein